MSKHRAVVFFILSFSFCVFAGSAHCQSPSESPKWQVKKLAIEVTRGSSEPEGDIFIIDPVNTKPRRLVEGAYPAWSPAGERIAYGTRSGHGYGQIYVINADGSGRRQLTNVNGGTFFSRLVARRRKNSLYRGTRKQIAHGLGYEQRR